MHLHSPFESRQLLYFFVGYITVFIAYLLYRLFKRYIKRIPFRKVSSSTNWILFVCNLAITLGGLAISLYAIGISEGIITMSDSDKAQLALSINQYIYLVWMMFGILVASMIIWFAQLFKKEENQQIDTGKVNRDFRKKIEKHFAKIERKKRIKEKIKSRISAIFSKFRS